MGSFCPLSQNMYFCHSHGKWVLAGCVASSKFESYQSSRDLPTLHDLMWWHIGSVWHGVMNYERLIQSFSFTTAYSTAFNTCKTKPQDNNNKKQYLSVDSVKAWLSTDGIWRCYASEDSRQNGFFCANYFFPFLAVPDRYSDWTYIRKKKGAGVIDFLCVDRKKSKQI